MLFGLFSRKKVLLLELGNYITKASVLEHVRNKVEVIDHASLVNPFFRNGIIRNKSAFIECISTLLAKLNSRNWREVIVGFDSSYISYNSFELSSDDASDEMVLRQISALMPNSKVMYHATQDRKVSTLSIQRNFLDKLYAYLELAEVHVTKFVPIKYFYAMSQLRNNDPALTMVVNLGYKSTNISVFKDDFLVSYKTVPLGVENVVFAISEKCGLFVDDAKLIIKEISLFETDEREWVSYHDKHFNKKHMSGLLNFYMRALVRKIISRDYNYVTDALLTGWATNINGIVQVFEKFIPNVAVTKDNDQPTMYNQFIPLIQQRAA